MRYIRNIGASELVKLLQGETIYGTYKSSKHSIFKQSYDGYICFFKDLYIWRGRGHDFTICCELPDSRICHRTNNDYYCDEDFIRTKIIPNKRGKCKYTIDEVQIKSYSIDDVKCFINTESLETKILKIFRPKLGNQLINNLHKYDIEFININKEGLK